MSKIETGCPFCGSMDLIVIRDVRTAFVRCLACKCEGPHTGDDTTLTDYMDDNWAIFKWENRSSEGFINRMK